MAKHANPTVVGGFVVGATVLALGGVLAFGSGELFAEENEFIAFFEGSVAGLDVGAPIRYRGVEMGTVSDIHAVWDPNAETIRIPVVLNFPGGKVESEEDEFEEKEPEELMAELIALGLRAELAQDSFVTGKKYVALDFLPEIPAVFIGSSDLPEIPTTTTGLAKLAKTLEEMPIGELVESLNETIREVRELVSDPELKEVIHGVNQLVATLNARVEALSGSAQLLLEDTRAMIQSSDDRLATLTSSADETMKDMRSLLAQLEAEVEPLSDSAQVTMADLQTVLRSIDEQVDPLATSLDQTLADARKLIGRFDEAAGGDYTLVLQLHDLLEEISQAARAVQALSNYLQQRPEALLTGKK